MHRAGRCLKDSIKYVQVFNEQKQFIFTVSFGSFRSKISYKVILNERF